MLKHLAEGGTAPGRVVTERLLRLLERPLAPDALLHVLQMLPHMDIEAAHHGALRASLLGLIKSRRAFVRAWAYNGLGVLAGHDPSLRSEVERLFDRAAKADTAAVRARIRHARAAMAG